MYILIDERLLSKKQEILGEELSMSNLGHFQQEYDLLSEKIHHLRMALAIETDAAVKFKLEKQLEEAETERNRIEQQLSRVEKLAVKCPYRGLSAFREQDEPFFFGRDTYIEKLVEAVRKQALVAVIGASGSGKSSLVYAGLIPRLRKTPGVLSREGQEWLILSFRPGENPLQLLSSALIPLLEPDLREVDQLVEINNMAKYLKSGQLHLPKVLVPCSLNFDQ
jgi:ABC-type glutathione transport system ATPase component